jgi:hypothetical protein
MLRGHRASRPSRGRWRRGPAPRGRSSRNAVRARPQAGPPSRRSGPRGRRAVRASCCSRRRRRSSDWRKARTRPRRRSGPRGPERARRPASTSYRRGATRRRTRSWCSLRCRGSCPQRRAAFPPPRRKLRHVRSGAPVRCRLPSRRASRRAGECPGPPASTRRWSRSCSRWRLQTAAAGSPGGRIRGSRRRGDSAALQPARSSSTLRSRRRRPARASMRHSVWFRRYRPRRKGRGDWWPRREPSRTG